MTAATPEQVRQITKDVLARPEFLPTTSWTQIILDRVFKWLRELAQWSARNPSLAKPLMFLLSIILVLLLAHIAYTVVTEFISLRKTADSGRRMQPLRALEGVAENWGDAFKLARAALEAGDIYRAVWITHRILLSILDRMGRIKFVRWKTNSDYLRECSNTDESAAALFALTSAYDRVIYAHDSVDQLQVVELLAQVQELAAKADA
jgi:hypothetical protein